MKSGKNILPASAYFPRIALSLLIFSAIFFSGCSARITRSDETPVEPIVPEGPSTGLLSYFGNLTAGRDINELMVLLGGEEVLVLPQDQRIYLLHQDGRILWETSLKGEAFKAIPSKRDSSFALVTREGKVVFFDAGHQVKAERNLQRQIVDFALAEDDSLAALLTLSPGSGQEAMLHLVDNRGFLLWEIPVAVSSQGPYDLHVSRQGEGIAFIGLLEGEPGLLWYSLKGELLWHKPGFSRLSLSLTGDVAAAIQGPLLMVFDSRGARRWGYDNTGVNLSHVMVSQDGRCVLAYSTYTTGQENLFYFPARGDTLPWKARVPAQSTISLSASGDEVVVTSWRHYLEEFTLVSVFNNRGQAGPTLQVAGRGKKAALSPRGNTLVLSSDDGAIFFLNLKDETLNIRHNTRPPTYAPAAPGRNRESVTLYFYNEHATELIPVSRRIGEGDGRLERALEELLKGPRLGSGLNRTIPRDAGITVEIRENTAYISLPDVLASLGGSAQTEGLINSIVYTCSHFSEISWVQFLVDGEPGGLLNGKIDISRPLPLRRPGSSPGRQVMYIPVLSGNRYYLRIQEVFLLAQNRRELAEKLLGKLLQENRAFFPQDMRVLSVTISGDTAKADFQINQEILGQLLRDADRSELLLDAVTLTISENFALRQVEVLINGLSSDKTLPSLLRTIARPLLINPE
jgi:spore germination protein GerM